MKHRARVCGRQCGGLSEECTVSLRTGGLCSLLVLRLQRRHIVSDTPNRLPANLRRDVLAVDRRYEGAVRQRYAALGADFLTLVKHSAWQSSPPVKHVLF